MLCLCALDLNLVNELAKNGIAVSIRRNAPFTL